MITNNRKTSHILRTTQPHKMIRVPSSLLHLRSFFTSSPFVSPFHIVFTLFTSSLLHCSFHRLFHHSFFTDRFSRELVEAFIAPFSSLSRTVHLWVSQLQIVLPLLYVLPLFYLFICCIFNSLFCC